MKTITQLWNTHFNHAHEDVREDLYILLETYKQKALPPCEDLSWYKKGVVYALYVDLFAGDFKGLKKNIPYLKELGVTVLWMLPILSSPMKDQGFDISDYYNVQQSLGGNEAFLSFVEEAHAHGIRLIFDIALNHTSSEHPWFKSAKSSKESPYRDYYIWSNTKDAYREALPAFEDSVWSYNPETNDYYYTTFYHIQPDVNYRNPRLLLEMIKVLLFWQSKGVDGFRLDAVHFYWKEEDTECFNLPELHTIIKIFRAALDYVKEGTLLVAEAPNIPEYLVPYFGNGDENHAVYNFPWKYRLLHALAFEDPTQLQELIEYQEKHLPGKNCIYFNLLQCHDDIWFDWMDKEYRQEMETYYLKDPLWKTQGGVSSRLYELLDKNVAKILLAYAMLFASPGMPVTYYGNEIAMENNRDYYKKMKEHSGFDDKRFLQRGPFDKKKAAMALTDSTSDSYKIYHGIKDMLALRAAHQDLFLEDAEITIKNKVLIFTRSNGSEKVVQYHNVTNHTRDVDGKTLAPYAYLWDFS